MALADGLRDNRELRTLDVTHNNIKERGAMVVADMLKENRGLRTVLLNQNPIGPLGAKAVLRCLRRNAQYGWRRSVRIEQCNMNYASDPAVFDPQEAGLDEGLCHSASPFSFYMEITY
jgi:hypothetical protein